MLCQLGKRDSSSSITKLLHLVFILCWLRLHNAVKALPAGALPLNTNTGSLRHDSNVSAAHLACECSCTQTFAQDWDLLQYTLQSRLRPERVSAVCRIGTTFQGKYSDSIKAAYPYPSSNFLDDLTWGAAWMYRKTGEQQFLNVRSRDALETILLHINGSTLSTPS